MRRSVIATLAAVFAFACTEVPSAPLLEPVAASFETSEPPPPWAAVHGSVETTEHGTVSFVGHLFINKPGNVAWLQFKSVSNVDGTATVTANARIMSTNGDVSGVGTISVGDGTIHLNEVTFFNYQTYRTDRTVSFSGGSITRGTAFSRKAISSDESYVNGDSKGGGR